MDTRTRVLEAALQLLHKEGFPALSQPRIAREAGLRQSHLTYYFPTRAALLQGIARYSIDQIRHEVPPGEPAGIDQLAAAVSQLSRIRMLAGLVQAADQDESLRPVMQELVNHVRQTLAAMLSAQGISASETRLAQLHATIVGLAMLHLARQNEDSAREIRQVLQQQMQLWLMQESNP